MGEEEKEGDEESIVKSDKKPKKRQKKILADLKKQIEFYFSEPNLQKDRFLRQKLTENPDGRIEIEIIASFNRMKALCEDITLIVKAMKMCPSVEVIDDKWVKPSKALTEAKNVDPQTIYVEPLPAHADHDWTKSVFSSFGNVVYVSLPRFKSTRKIKGFAFVEFEKESEAKLAIEMFSKKNNTDESKEEENNESLEKNEDVIVETTEKQGKRAKKRKQKQSESENEENKVKGKKSKHKKGEETVLQAPGESSSSSTGLTSDSKSNKKKRKSLDKEDNTDNEADVKSKKIEVKNEHSDSDASVDNRKRKRESGAEDNEGEDSASKKKAKQISDEEDVEIEDKKQKKHRKRKRKKKEKEEIPDLKVISKVEWLRLKTEYQKLRREAMKETKTNLKKPERTSKQLHKNEPQKPSEMVEDVPEEKPKSTTAHMPEKLDRLPGVVLRYSTKENIQKRELRELFSSVASVSYIEKEDEQDTGYVRFATPDACKKVVEATTNGSLVSINVQELTEKEDEEYWERLNTERIERFQQKKRKKRGTQKIVDKMEAKAKNRDHIHFDDQ